MHEIQDYLTAEGKDPFKDWVSGLADRMARARVLARVQRMAAGNFGDCKPLDGGVWELRIDHGPGYRPGDHDVRRPVRIAALERLKAEHGIVPGMPCGVEPAKRS